MANDALQQLERQIRSYVELARRILRRWWLIGIFTFLGAGVSIAVALNMTRIYQSRTLVEFKEVVKDRRAFTGSEFHRDKDWLRTSLHETFSSQTFLMTMMRKLDLFPEMRQNLAPEDVLLVARDHIKFGMVGEGSFWISFDHKEPRTAQKVAAYLTREFIRRNVLEDVRSAQTMLTFMTAEVNKTEVEMNAIEDKVARFVSDHPEYRVLPGISGPAPATHSGHPGSSSVIPAESSPALRLALSQKGRLQAQLQLLMNPQGNAKLVQVRQEVDRAEQRVTTLRHKYSERHPDVQNAMLYLRQAQTQLRLAQSAGAGEASNIARIRSEIDGLDASIAKLSRPTRIPSEPAKRQPREVLTQRAQMEKLWYELTRDREVVKSKYDLLQDRLSRARITANLERKQAETQFVIVDAANLPHKPIRPSRSKLAMAGTALGFMLGLAIAVLLVIFDGRIFNEQDLKKVCDLPLLAQIPRES